MAATPPPPPPPPPGTSRKGPSESGTPGTSDTPPRRSSPGPGARSQRAPAKTQLQRSLEELFSAPALAYALAGDQWAAQFVNERAPVLAEAWADLAKQNPAVKRILERITQGSAWGGVIVATGGTVLPLLAHHELLPAPVAAVFDTGEPSPSGPIVPPPPAPSGPPPGATPGRSQGRGRDTPPSGMTAPLREGQPPGVVTVAGTNNGAQ